MAALVVKFCALLDCRANVIMEYITDDIATQDDIATHIEAVAAHERGETIDFYDIDWDNFDNTDSV